MPNYCLSFNDKPGTNFGIHPL